MILIWTTSIWKIKTSCLPLQQKEEKEEPQISTDAASLGCFDVRVVPKDQPSTRHSYFETNGETGS